MHSENAIAAFAALAQPTRLEAFRALIEAGVEGMTAGVLAETCDASGPVMSFHLKELLRAGLLKSRRDGRQIYYAADYAGVQSLIDFIIKDCCKSDPRCCGPFVGAPLQNSEHQEAN